MSLNGSIPANGPRKGMWLKSIPAHPGFFRKTRSPYSTMIAGIISTSPGITLGNNFDAKADKWEDNRPMLALAGRVPVKVTTENGPIQIGEPLGQLLHSRICHALLRSSNVRRSSHWQSSGTVGGRDRDEMIMVQVILR